MIKKTLPTMGRYVVGILFLLIFLIINSGIPTTHQINITVVVGIFFTMVNILGCKIQLILVLREYIPYCSES